MRLRLLLPALLLAAPAAALDLGATAPQAGVKMKSVDGREVSIAEVRQEGVVDEGGHRVGARVVVVTHEATDAALSDTVAALAGLDVVQNVASVLRLEGNSE